MKAQIEEQEQKILDISVDTEEQFESLKSQLSA